MTAAASAEDGFGLRVHSHGHERGTISVGSGAQYVVIKGVTSNGSGSSLGAFIFVHPAASVQGRVTIGP